MKLSVIILNYNVRFFLEACVQSVQDALLHIDAEIIVADNNSSDDSCTMLSEKFPDVTLIANKENFGFAKANNKAVEIAQGEYVLILNPDTIVADGTFEAILSFADAKEKFGALGVKLVDGGGAFLPESKRGVPTPKASFEKLMGLKTHGKGAYYADHLNENQTGKVPILVGAFMLMKKEVYQEVGGFDERYFMYGEDIDLSYKIVKKGYDNYYYADAEVIHFKGESTQKTAKNLKDFNDAMRIFYKDHFSLNPVYDVLMRFGIVGWYLLKVVQSKKTVVSKDFYGDVLYWGKDNKVVKSLMLNYPNIDFDICTSFDDLVLKISEKNIEEIIFDIHFVTYSQMIASMQKLRKLGVCKFKIRPKNANYIFGSNDSTSRGRVISL